MSQSRKCKAHIVISEQKEVEFNGLHIHEPKDTVESLLFVKELKFEAVKDPYSTAPQIVSRLLAQKGFTEDKYHTLVNVGMPTTPALLQIVHRIRRKFLPPKQLQLFFDVDYQFLSMDFLQKDLLVDDQRYLLLSTSEQLGYLLDALTWFVDGTFAIAKKNCICTITCDSCYSWDPFQLKIYSSYVYIYVS